MLGKMVKNEIKFVKLYRRLQSVEYTGWAGVLTLGHMDSLSSVLH